MASEPTINELAEYSAFRLYYYLSEYGFGFMQVKVEEANIYNVILLVIDDMITLRVLVSFEAIENDLFDKLALLILRTRSMILKENDTTKLRNELQKQINY